MELTIWLAVAAVSFYMRHAIITVHRKSMVSYDALCRLLQDVYPVDGRGANTDPYCRDVDSHFQTATREARKVMIERW